MPEAGRLVITVVENPTINQIAFEGNDSLDDEELNAVINSAAARLLGGGGGAGRAAHHRRIPRGRALRGGVNPVLIRQPDNRVDLVFEISEGAHLGAAGELRRQRVFSDRRLRRVIQTNQANWLSFIFGNVTYDQDRLEVDRELLRQFYLERGYIDFQVLSATAELARERTGFFLSFTVSEGQRSTSAASRSAPRSPASTPPISSRCWRRWRRAGSTTSRWSTASSSAWHSRPGSPATPSSRSCRR